MPHGCARQREVTNVEHIVFSEEQHTGAPNVEGPLLSMNRQVHAAILQTRCENGVIKMAVSLLHLHVCQASALLDTTSFRSRPCIRDSDSGYEVCLWRVLGEWGVSHIVACGIVPTKMERFCFRQRAREESASQHVISGTGSYP